jgi:hypothetical protein
MRPFTSNVKSPSVRRIAGNERTIIIGFRRTFTTDRIKPASKNKVNTCDSSYDIP